MTPRLAVVLTPLALIGPLGCRGGLAAPGGTEPSDAGCVCATADSGSDAGAAHVDAGGTRSDSGVRTDDAGSGSVDAGCCADDAGSNVPDAGRSGSDGGYVWDTVPIWGGGFVPGLVIHPSSHEVYVRTDVGGAFRWDPATSAFVGITDPLNLVDLNSMYSNDRGGYLSIESIALDPNDANTVYVAAGQCDYPPVGRIFKSTDHAATWTPTPLTATMSCGWWEKTAGERLAVDPNDSNVLYYASRDEGLFVTTDGANTWNPVSSFPTNGNSGDGLAFVIYDPSSGSPGHASQTLYVGAQGAGVYVSHNGGSSWSFLGGPGSGAYPCHGVLASDGSLYVTYSQLSGGSGAVYRCDSSGCSDISPFAAQWTGVDVDPTNASHVVVMDWAGNDGLHQSFDRGATWHTNTAHAAAPSTIIPNLVMWFLGPTAVVAFDRATPTSLWNSGDSPWRTDDLTPSTLSWAPQVVGINEVAPYLLRTPPSGAPLLTGCGDVGGFRSDAIDAPPVSFMAGGVNLSNTTGIDFAENDPNIVAVVGTDTNTYGYYSTDNAHSFTAFGSLPPGATYGRIAVSADGSAFVWAAVNLVPYVSKDRGTTWTASTGAPSNVIGQRFAGNDSLAADTVQSSWFYIYYSGAFYRSEDSGLTWSKTASLPDPDVACYAQGSSWCAQRKSVRPTPGVAGDVWVNLDWNGLYHSTDSGGTFGHVESVVAAYSFALGAPAPDSTHPTIYLFGTVQGGGSDNGFYRSIDNAATWVRIDQPGQTLGSNVFAADRQTFGRVYVGNSDHGVVMGHL